LVGELSTTILTGGYILRKCYKYSRSQELWLKLMPFRMSPLIWPVSSPPINGASIHHGSCHSFIAGRACGITDDALWRPTRCAREHYAKNRRGRDAEPSTAAAGYTPLLRLRCRRRDAHQGCRTMIQIARSARQIGSNQNTYGSVMRVTSRPVLCLPACQPPWCTSDHAIPRNKTPKSKRKKTPTKGDKSIDRRRRTRGVA
jgi:hypothetical protein